jgi:hypothetical protein
LASSTSGFNYGVYGQTNSTAGTAIYGLANASSGFTYGVVGQSNSDDGIGVVGIATANGDSYAILAENQATTGNTYGLVATTANGTAIYAQGPTGIRVDGFSALSGNVGIIGDLVVNGDMDVSGDKNFKIDHPMDPANRYLYHASIESFEVLDLYSGSAVLDANGEAWIELPEWMEVLNRDFRYQLTAIGAPSPGLHVADEIRGNRFRIAGGAHRSKVSWQVTGIRNDPYHQARPFVAERMKPADEQGFYLRPELYGQPAEKGILFGRNRSQTPRRDHRLPGADAAREDGGGGENSRE